MMNYKFRGKRLDDGEWVFGSLIITNGHPPCIMTPENDGYDVDPATVGMYTGEKINDVEAYEHDIVQVLGRRKCVIRFEDGGFNLYIADTGIIFAALGYAVNPRKEGIILGSIHDTPTLLTTKEKN